MVPPGAGSNPQHRDFHNTPSRRRSVPRKSHIVYRKFSDLTTAAGENPASSLPALAGQAIKFLDPISYPPIQVAGGASISH